MNTKIKAMLSLSGGIDSTTVLFKMRQGDREIHTVFFTYGSKHNAHEIIGARNIANTFADSFKVVDLSEVMLNFKSDLLLTGGKIPEGHYEDENMKKTVVPCRNLIFSSVLAGLAESNESKEIWLGVHAGDHAIYPDCRPGFIQALERTVYAATDRTVMVKAPYLYKNKAEIIKEGLQMHIPYEMTRTCYKNQPIACGKCGSCVERLEAFKLNNTDDPIQYERI